MSLINKMLQDLDARGGAGDDSLRQQQLKAVPGPERERRPLVLVAGASALALLAAGAWFGWQYWQRAAAPQGPVPKVINYQAQPRSEMSAPLAANLPVPVPAAAPAPAPASTPVAQQAGTTPASPSPSTKPAPVSASAPVASSAAVKPQARVHTPDAGEHSPANASGDTVAPGRQELSPQQRADTIYRHALVALQDGRVSVAFSDLERALEIDPRNESARQTYITLLLESKRSDDAMLQLRAALALDARQPALALVLAGLQLERGGPALQTLMTTLPFAANNAGYQAFVAGVLQREQRHAEAAQYYRAALKLAPGNGVWWMGLAISLQADQHLPEAREAYQRARQSNGMSAELLTFIDRKIEQLSR